MYEEIVIAGFGGQGVMSLGKVIAHAGMKAGKEVSWIPSYGPEMRGGTANCTVIISDKRIPSPFSSEPDTAIIMNLPSLHKFIDTVKSGGLALVNSSLIDENIARDDIDVVQVPAGKIAGELGSDRIANMVMLGAYLNHNKLLTQELIEKALKAILPERRHNLLAINNKALQKGMELG